MISFLNLRYFILLFLLGWAHSAQSQNFESGLHFGINASQVNGDYMAGFNKIGFAGGLFTDYKINDKWRLSFNMLYSQKGSKRVVSPSRVDSGLWDMLTIHYIEVPFYAQYQLLPRASLNAGIGFAYNMGISLYDPSGKIEGADFVKKVELLTHFGGSWQLTEKLSFFGRYSHSLLPVGKNNTTINALRFGSGLYHSVVSFGLKYHFIRQSW